MTSSDLLAFYRFPPEHWTKLRSTNPLERVNKEIGRRSDVVGIFPNDASVIRLVGALLIEQNDEWLCCRRYLSAESMALIRSSRIPKPSRARSADRPTRRWAVSPPAEPPSTSPTTPSNHPVAGRRRLRASEAPRSTSETDRTPPQRRARACRRSPSPLTARLKPLPSGLGLTPTRASSSTNQTTRR